MHYFQIAYMKDLVSLPNKSQLRWTNYHMSVMTGFLEDSKERTLCLYLLKPASKIANPNTGEMPPPRLAIGSALPTSSAGQTWYFIKLDIHSKIMRINFSECVT